MQHRNLAALQDFADGSSADPDQPMGRTIRVCRETTTVIREMIWFRKTQIVAWPGGTAASVPDADATPAFRM